MKRVYILLLFVFIMFVGVMPVEAKEYDVCALQNDDILNPGDKLIFPEELRCLREPKNLYFSNDFGLTLTFITIDGATYGVDNSSFNVMRMFNVDLIQNNFQFDMPDFESIKSIDFTKIDYFLVSSDSENESVENFFYGNQGYELLTDVEKYILIKKIYDSDGATYNVSFV